MNTERVKRFIASADNSEEEQAEFILNIARFRRAIYKGYVAAGFSPEEAIAFITAELSAPEVVFEGGDDA